MKCVDYHSVIMSVFERTFTIHRPAVRVFEVQALPQNALVAVDCIAYTSQLMCPKANCAELSLKLEQKQEMNDKNKPGCQEKN